MIPLALRRTVGSKRGRGSHPGNRAGAISVVRDGGEVHYEHSNSFFWQFLLFLHYRRGRGHRLGHPGCGDLVGVTVAGAGTAPPRVRDRKLN